MRNSLPQSEVMTDIQLSRITLFPAPADYRWMDDGDESPWFPGTRVYRETRADGWGLALEDLAADLAAAWPAAGAAST